MKNIWGLIIDAILAILIMFGCVTIYFGVRMETSIKSVVKNDTQKFVTDIKKKGYFTLNDYENFCEKLDITHSIYGVTFEHTYHVWEPEYRMKTLQEILDEQNASYTGSNVYTYREVNTPVPVVNDPVNTGSLNTETNESVLASAVNTSASASHIHTDNCYEGHLHTILSETPFIHYHKHDSNCHAYISYSEGWCYCGNCDTKYQTSSYAAYWDSSTNSAVGVSGWGQDSCPNCGSTSQTGAYVNQDIRYSCGYDRDSDGDKFLDLSDAVNTYEYYKNYPQDTTTRATYTDGCYSYHIPGSLQYTTATAYLGYGIYKDYTTGWYNPNQGMSGTYGCYLFYADNYYGGCTNTFRKILDSNFTCFCRVPQYYRFSLEIYNPTGGNYFKYYTFKLSADLTQFEYVRGSGSDLSYYIELPPISVDDMKKMSYGYLSFYVWLKTYAANISYTGNPAFGCYSMESASNGSGASGLDGYGYITCNHSVCNQWYLSCGQIEDGGIDCGMVVTSIVPTHPDQTVAFGDDIISTVIATYLDGSTKTIVGSVSGYNKNLLGNQTVTLTYSGLLDDAKSTGTKTCIISVTVVARTKTCSNGHTYNLNNDGSDPGCPYCREYLKMLQFIYPTTTNMTITIGTALPDNGVKLLATYMDGHSETLSCEYVDNLDHTYLGTMIVTIGYKGASLQLRVTTVCKIMKCDICGNDYDLYPDGSDPGCPYCLMKIPVFTGNVMEKNEAVYTEDILEKLYQTGKYEFNKNDSLKISIRNRSSNIARNMLNIILPSLSEEWINMVFTEEICAEESG